MMSSMNKEQESTENDEINNQDLSELIHKNSKIGSVKCPLSGYNDSIPEHFREEIQNYRLNKRF